MSENDAGVEPMSSACSSGVIIVGAEDIGVTKGILTRSTVSRYSLSKDSDES